MHAQVPANTTTARADYLGPLIERAAFDPDFRVEKLQALLDMRDTEVMREDERRFNAALVAAQAEMEPIRNDANNPQTRSNYATYAAVDRAIRPIYTRHGLAPSFGTEPLDGEKIRVYAILSHRDGGARRYSIDMPGSPGVYRMIDAGGNVLYVGKAKHLKNRVSSYLNVAALKPLRGRMTPENQALFDLFCEARDRSFFGRQIGFLKTGIYRQTPLGNVGLIVASLLKKL